MYGYINNDDESGVGRVESSTVERWLLNKESLNLDVTFGGDRVHQSHIPIFRMRSASPSSTVQSGWYTQMGTTDMKA